MRRRIKDVWQYGVSPLAMRRFNFWAMIFFLALMPFAVTIWRNSVPLLVAISVYAIIASHLGGWQSSRVEERQDQEIDDK